MEVNTSTTCTTIGAYTNVSRTPDYVINNTKPLNLSNEIYKLYLHYHDSNHMIWTSYYENIVFLTTHNSTFKSNKAILSKRIYAYKHAVLDIIWRQLIDVIENNNEESNEYKLVGAKNHFKGLIGFRKNDTYETNASGFKHAIHIKIQNSTDHIINLMFYVGSGSCNITGTKLYEESKNSMMLLTSALNGIFDVEPCFFIKPHMNKVRVIMGANESIIDPSLLTLDKTRKRINFNTLKHLIENDGSQNDYRVVRIDNMACIRLNIIQDYKSFDVYTLSSDNIWSVQKRSLIDIDKNIFPIKASKLSKELKKLYDNEDINCEIKVNFELVSGKISICGKYSDLALDVRDEIIDIINNHINNNNNTDLFI